MVSIQAHEHIGVLMLNTQFPRLLGDIGNAKTFSGRVRYYVVENACLDSVVSNQLLAESLVDSFIAQALLAQSQGAKAILTSCGFLATIQQQLENVVDVPVISSSLILLPSLMAQYNLNEIAIITADASKLNANHFACIGINYEDCLIFGMEKSPVFNKVILHDSKVDDEASCYSSLEKEVMLVIHDALSAKPNIKAILLECTNLSPYKKRMMSESKRAVYDVCSMVSII